MAATPKLSTPKHENPQPASSPRSAPSVSDPIEVQVLEVFRELLTELGSHRAAQTVSLDSSLDRELSLGSLERVELLVRFESRFNARLRDELAQEADTPADWLRALRAGNHGAVQM